MAVRGGVTPMASDFWTVYWTFTAFVFGAIVGSFLNVCIWRMPRGESLVSPPSHCPACDHRLHLLPDMVPLLSQLWYRSRCRYCGTHFSWRYFWVELFTAVVFAAIYVRYAILGPPELPEMARTGSAICGMIFVSALITIFFIDLESYTIPDMAVLVALLAAVAKDVLLIVTAPHVAGARQLWQPVWETGWMIPVPQSILSGLIAFWLLWQFAALTTAFLGREAMGAGDSLLLGAMGAFLVPWPLLVLAFMVAVGLGTVGGVTGLLVASRRSAPAQGGDEEGIAPSQGAQETGDSAASLEGGTLTAASPAEPASAHASVPPPAGDPGQPAFSTAHRGGIDLPPPALEEAGVPRLPPASRWGRLWTVLGTWVAVGGLWFGARALPESPALGIGAAVVAAALAAGMLVYGIRRWLAGDQEWLPAMDLYFEEGEVGPRFIPFGPYLVLGTLVAMFFGHSIIEWYVTKVLVLGPIDVGSMGWF